MTRGAVLVFSIAAAAILSFRPIYEPDLWWHLAHGRENAVGRIVRTNVFSFTYPEYRQRYTSWLFDTSAYVAWRSAGHTGIQLLQTVTLTASLLTLFAACRKRAPAWACASVLLLAFFVLEPRAIPRPHLVSFAGLALCALLIERAVERRSAAPLRWAIPVVAIWSNLHVECLFGVLMLGVFAAAETVRPGRLTRPEGWKALAITGVCALATLANPYGWGLAAYLYENLSVPAILVIAELQPPRLPAYRAFFAFAALAVLLLAVEPRRLTLSELATALVFAVLGFLHLRETPLVVFATAPLIASRLDALTRRRVDYRAITFTMVLASLTMSRIPLPLLLTEFAIGRRAVEPPRFFSNAAIEFAANAGLEGPLFNSHNLGGYIAWTMYPRARVFQDSRLQAYPPEHFRAIIQASAKQEYWNALTTGVDWAMVSVPRPNQLSGAGRFPASEWRSVYQDDAIEIVVRTAGKFGEVGR